MNDISLILTNNYHSVLEPLPNVSEIVEVNGIPTIKEKPPLRVVL